MATQLEIQNIGASINDALDRVRRGEEVAIADHGQAVAKIVPIEPEQ